MRRFKTLGAAAMVLTAFGSLFAGSASAAAVTQDVKWFTGALPGVALVGAEAVGTAQVGRATLFTEVGAVEYEIEWTGTKCVGCTIENAGGTAVGSGKLELVGVAALKPAGCNVAAAITTKPLSLQADWMKALNLEPNYWKFTPTAGPATAFATLEFFGCPQALVIVPKGIVFAQTTNATEVQALEQEVTTSEAINTAASGAEGALHAGAEPVELTAALKFKMTGGKVGQVFGTH